MKAITLNILPFSAIFLIWLLTWREPDLLGALIKIAYKYVGE